MRAITPRFSFIPQPIVVIQAFRDKFRAAVLVDAGMAQGVDEAEVDQPGLIFFVVAHQGQQGGVVAGRDGVAPEYPDDEAADLFHFGQRQAQEAVGQVGFANHADGHGFAVQQGGVGFEGQAFDGMADGMPEVEGFADAFFPGVFFHDALFDEQGRQDGRAPVDAVQGADPADLFPLNGIGDEAVFDGLGEAAADFPGRQGAEEGRVDENREGVLKKADAVFELKKIDAQLSADGGVQLGQQGGGDLDEADAALEGGCAEAAHVADHAAAEVDQQRVAAGLLFHQLLPDEPAGVQVFVLFAGGRAQQGEGRPAQRRLQPRQAVPLGVLIDGDEKPGVRQARQKGRQPRIQRAGENVVML